MFVCSCSNPACQVNGCQIAAGLRQQYHYAPLELPTPAPAQAVRNFDLAILQRASEMLTAYAELILRDGATHVEEHHYVPDVRWTAGELRGWAANGLRGE